MECMNSMHSVYVLVRLLKICKWNIKQSIIFLSKGQEKNTIFYCVAFLVTFFRVVLYQNVHSYKLSLYT